MESALHLISVLTWGENNASVDARYSRLIYQTVILIKGVFLLYKV